MGLTILVVDDDADLNQMIVDVLQHRGFHVLSTTSGSEALKIAYESRPSLILLDIIMPGMDGWQVCERLRDMSDTPIIFLTAKEEEQDIVHGFQLGADDYIRKPFSIQELEMRVRAVLRRASAGQKDNDRIYDDGTLRVDMERQHVFRDGQMVSLTPTEYRLLTSLVLRSGHVIPHEELIAEVWGEHYTRATDSLSLYIRYLREKLEKNPSEPYYIRTKWGFGYWFTPLDAKSQEEPNGVCP